LKFTDYSRLIAQLSEAYLEHAPKSARTHERAKRSLVDGGSHAMRLMQPFPPSIVSAQGAWLTDEDGHKILDFWQGHFANILGHNPEVVTSALADALEKGYGLQTGFEDRLQMEAAEILCRQTASERVRFTTSGTLATMYAIQLSCAFTGRDTVMKVGAGWHGGQPWGLKGVRFRPDTDRGFQHVESQGLPAAVTDKVVVTRFNDAERLRDDFRKHGDRLACFIVEPFLGAGGCLPASREFLHAARELTHRYGAVLIFDEVIAGFRFRAGDVGSLYGLRPDLATFGKAIGGGMPVAAVGGRGDIMKLAGRQSGGKVSFSGGTYSGHPASMLAAKTYLQHLVAHEEEIYPRLADLGAKARLAVEAAFAEEGVYARCTSPECVDDTLPGSSLSVVAFPYEQGHELRSPDDLRNPAACDVALSEQVLRLALLNLDVHSYQGLGAMSMAHTEEDIGLLEQASRQVARLIKEHR
jgi:glutamate-1-semialdehyde 2,1-aminomutase